MAEIGEQLPSDFDHEPVDRSVVSFSSCAILPLRRRESELEFDLALAVLRDLREMLPAANVHRFIQNPTIEKIMDRDLFTDSFCSSGVVGSGTRSSRAELEKSRVQREAGSSSQGYSAVTPGPEERSKQSNAQRTVRMSRY